MVRAILAWFLAVASAAASAQSIVKCLDTSGNVTYQDAPCTGGHAGRSGDLPKAETREDTNAPDAPPARRTTERWAMVASPVQQWPRYGPRRCGGNWDAIAFSGNSFDQMS